MWNQKNLRAQKVPLRENSSLGKILWHILKQLSKKEVLHYRNTINFQNNHQNTVVPELHSLTETSQQLQMLYIVLTGVQRVSNTLKQTDFLASFCHTFEHTLRKLLLGNLGLLRVILFTKRMEEGRSNNGIFQTRQISKSHKKKEQLY